MDLPISALPNATTPLAGTEAVAIVQGGTTKQAPASAFGTPGPTVQLSNLQIATSGNVLNIAGTNPEGLVRATLTVTIISEAIPGTDTMTLAVTCENDQEGQFTAFGPVYQANMSPAPSNFAADSNVSPMLPQAGAVLTLEIVFAARASTSVSASIGSSTNCVYNAFLTLEPVVTTSF